MRRLYHTAINVMWAVYLLVNFPTASIADNGKTVSGSIIEFLLTWVAPLIILLGIWAFIFKKGNLGHYRKHMEKAEVHMDKVEKLLERIAAAVEKKAISKD